MTQGSDDPKKRTSIAAARDSNKRASIAEARDRLASLIHGVENGAPVEITRRGRPVAVIVSYHEYQRLLGEGPSFWDALLAFRSATHANDTQFFEDIDFPRDKTFGRSSPFQS